MSTVRLAPFWATLVLTAACGSSSPYGGSPANSSAAPSTGGPVVVNGQPINDGGAFDATQHRVVTVQAENFRFTPSVITGTPGEVLTLEITNPSATKHNLTQADQKVNADLDPGAHATVTLTVPASGQLVFTCEYHAKAGMAGTVQSPGATAAPASSDVPYGK